MNAPRPLGLGFAALALLALAPGCGRGAPPFGRAAVATELPSAPGALAIEPAARYPPASRLVLLDLADPDAAHRLLSAGMVAAGGPSLSSDGARIVFVGKEVAGDPYGVWTASIDGSRRRPAALPETDCGAAAFLPDGRIVASCRSDGPAPSDELTSAWALFVTAEDGGEAQRITFGASELDPALLADGRIVYAQWQPEGDGRPAGGSFSLFTVHPDGTGAAPLHGFHHGPRVKLLPRQMPDGDLVYLSRNGVGASQLQRVDWGQPTAPPAAVELPAGRPLSVEPAADGGLLVAAAAVSPGREGGLYLFGDGGRIDRLGPGDGGPVLAQAVEVAPRRRPQGQMSMVKPESASGRLLGLDARPPGTTAGARVRLAIGTPGAPPTLLGEVLLEEDGSFFAAVPANVPLVLTLLDQAGATLVETTTPIWVRGNETRACVGCHEDPMLAPPNRRPLALARVAADLTGGRP